MIQFVSEPEYLEAVCGDWSDYAETEDHKADDHDQCPKQHNTEESSRRKKGKTTPSLMAWVLEVYAYFCNMPHPSSKLFLAEEMDNSSPRK